MRVKQQQQQQLPTVVCSKAIVVFVLTALVQSKHFDFETFVILTNFSNVNFLCTLFDHSSTRERWSKALSRFPWPRFVSYAELTKKNVLKKLQN